MNTPWGASPNPIPHKILCASGERALSLRVEQMLASWAVGSAGGPIWEPPEGMKMGFLPLPEHLGRDG